MTTLYFRFKYKLLACLKTIIIISLIITNLSEEVPGQLFVHDSLLGDEVEKIFTRLRPLHDDDEGVVPLEVVDQLHHALHAGHAVHQANLHGDSIIGNLEEKVDLIRSLVFTNYG